MVRFNVRMMRVVSAEHSINKQPVRKRRSNLRLTTSALSLKTNLSSIRLQFCCKDNIFPRNKFRRRMANTFFLRYHPHDPAFLIH